jgi:D-3-phosphoglycerate dehydrogenase / 2-oxoglutarate reductase
MKILVGFEKKDYPSVRCFEDIGECDFVRYDYYFLENNIHKYDIIVPHLFEYLDDKILMQATNLKILATPSTGKNHLDLKTLVKKDVKFISLNDSPNFINQITSTSELAWLLILACSRNILEANKRVHVDKSWINTDIRGIQLRGKTLGVIGYGRLGKFLARYANAFEMNVLAYDVDVSKYDQYCNGVSLNDLYSTADIISLHVKLNSDNHNMIGTEEISKFKPGTILVNTARGELVDSNAILKGFEDGNIASVGLDVLPQEYAGTQLPNDPLIHEAKKNKRIIITPHIGGSTMEAHNIVFDVTKNLILDYSENSND